MKPKQLSILSVLAALMLLTARCGDDEGITHSLTDVSSRVTGFSKEKVGAGAELTVNGSQLQGVKRIFVGNEVVRAGNFISQTESSITFNVPTAVALGMNNVLLVFAGSERAATEIEVIPLQAVTSFTPYSAAAGEKVTMLGINFDLVTGVKLGDLDATIVSQTPTALQFTTPAGFNTSGKITLVGTAGNANTATDLIACTGASVADCANGLNSNDGFELGTGDTFTNWAKQNGGGFMLATTAPGEVYRGSRAVKVTRDGSLNPADQWRIQLVSDAKETTIGASYTVFVWAKAVGTPGSMRVSTAPSALYTADQVIPTTWTRLAFTFTANVASTSIALDMNGAAVTTFFIDDVKLIKNP